jgi:hypothetical protein
MIIKLHVVFFTFVEKLTFRLVGEVCNSSTSAYI